MNPQIRDTIDTTARQSKEGVIHFGQVLQALGHVGVEAYHADYRAGATTYYLGNDEVHAVPLDPPAVDIAQPFDAAALQAAIRGAQRGDVMYPQFMALSRAAGCVGYTVWLAGRHVAYFGRRGETHVERFPD